MASYNYPPISEGHPEKQPYAGYDPQPSYRGSSYQQSSIPLQNQQTNPFGLGAPTGPPPPYSFEEKFTLVKPTYNDIWAAAVFLADLLGLVAVSGLSLHSYKATKRSNGKGIHDSKSKSFGLTANTVVLFALVLVVALAVSALYFMVARKFTKKVIWITGILNILFGIGTAVYYLLRHQYIAAIVFFIFAGMYAFCFWTWRFRIPFSVLMLQSTIDVSKNCGHIFRVSAIGGFTALCTGAWFGATFVAVHNKYSPSKNNPTCTTNGGSCSKAKMFGLLVFVVFSFYWLSEVIKNVMHVSVSGVYGSWYFCSRTRMPSHPTIGAFKRAMTYSFGSICFGSLIVSIIQLLKQGASIMQQNEAVEGNTIACVLWALAKCVLGLVESIIEYFNHYAYSYIALYGDAYIPAAKATWNMMKDRGVDALVNDCLVDPVLTMGAVFIGYLCVLVAYIYLVFTQPLYNKNGEYTVVVMAFSFLVGLQIANVFLVPIKSGIATLFTSMAHHPEILRRDHPELYQKMVAVYPTVQDMISASAV